MLHQQMVAPNQNSRAAYQIKIFDAGQILPYTRKWHRAFTQFVESEKVLSEKTLHNQPLASNRNNCHKRDQQIQGNSGKTARPLARLHAVKTSLPTCTLFGKQG
jgi:hypothetical protein